jgi:hypothetical protein
VNGVDCLQLSYRGKVGDAEVAVSAEHDGARSVDPVQFRASISDEIVDALAAGNRRVGDLVRRVRTDRDRYLVRTGRT